MVTQNRVSVARVAVISLMLAVGAHVAHAAHPALTLTGDAPWLLAAAEPLALQLAVKDVARDAYAVLGYPPLVAGDPADVAHSFPASVPLVVFATAGGAASPWLSGYDLAACDLAAGEEAHCVVAFAAGEAGPASRPAVVAVGNGTRGAIFAAYALSEELFGVPPLHHFADVVPVFAGSIDIASSGVVAKFGPPAFKWRSFFTNDEDLTGNLFPSPTAETVFSLPAWDHFFEAALRSKTNAFLPGTDPFPDEKSLALASRRGLAITSHHFDLLGTCVHRWPLPRSDWNYTYDPATMAFAWNASVWAQSGYEMLWSTGLRGLDDYAYPCSGATECAAALSDAMGNQTQWVRQAQGDPAIVTYLWDEGLEYLQAGLLRVPDGVRLVFGDEGAGFVHGDGNLTKYAAGLYYHTAMVNGQANQLTEMVPVSRIFDQIGLFVRLAKELFYTVLNLSDLRPAIMTSSAALAFMYDPAAFGTGANPNATALAYMENWTSTYYGLQRGSTAAAAAAQWWDDYFHVPYIVGGMSDDMLSRGGLRPVATALAADIRAGKGVSSGTLQRAATALGHINASAPLWAPLLSRAESQLLPQIPPARQAFFNAHAVVQAAIHTYGCAALGDLVGAVQALSMRNATAASALLAKSLSNMDELFRYQRGAEYGIWRGLYAGDRIVDMHQARRDVADAAYALAGDAPTAQPQRPLPGYDSFYAYQLEHTGNFPYMYPNRTVNMDGYVRIYCAGTHSTGIIAGCSNTPDGGVFDTATTKVELGDSTYTLRYTLNGTEPTASSAAYAAPLLITKQTTIRAVAFDGDDPVGGITTAVFSPRRS